MLGYGRRWRSAQVIPSWGAFLCAAFRSSRPTPQRAGRYSPTHSLSSLARRSAWRRAVGGRRRSEPPLEFRAIGLHPLIDPAEYRVVPENTVGGFEHPVILRLEVEEFRRDVLGLQHLEHRQALARIDAVVVAAVDDEHRGAEVARVSDGRLLDERLWVLPGGALELLQRAAHEIGGIDCGQQIVQPIVGHDG